LTILPLNPVPFDPDIHLSNLRAGHKRLCFYPSSGSDLLWAIMRLNADVFIFSDYGPRDGEGRKRFWNEVAADFRKNAQPLALVRSTVRTRVFKSGDKWGFLFYQDNNDALARIKEAGWKIDMFVGIRDGCAEGGNYQCVHDDPFLTKLLAAASDSLVYFTNHSRLLTDDEQTRQRGHMYFKRRVLHKSIWEFVLRSVLVVPDWVEDDLRSPLRRLSGGSSLKRTDLAVFCPSPGRSLYSIYDHGPRATEHEIHKLSDFRVRHNEGVVAHYDVKRLQPQQEAGADAEDRAAQP
jgi:hypothetical protein